MPGPQWQYNGQRTGPEMICQQLGRIIPHDIFFGTGNIRHMHNQRIETGPAFRCVDVGNCGAVSGICTQSVNRLGRERDQIAAAQQLCCTVQIAFNCPKVKR